MAIRNTRTLNVLSGSDWLLEADHWPWDFEDDPQVFDDPKGTSIGSMDFDNSKIYGDTSISDGLVCLLVVCHICEWQRLIIAGDWINVCGWTECRDLGRADVYFQALTAGPWFIQCLHTAKQIEQSHQKLPHNMLACHISLNRARTDSLTSVSQLVLGYSPKTLRKYFLVSSLSMKLNIII